MARLLQFARAPLSALALVTVLAACGGGEFAELFVRLITARFVPAEIVVARGSTQRVELEVTCDRDALDTPFGRLDVEVRFDPPPPAGIVASFPGATLTADGYAQADCNDPTADPALRIARIPVDIGVATTSEVVAWSAVARVRIEPLTSGDPSKDETLAELAVRVVAPATPGANLLVDPGFEDGVATGPVPSVPGSWRGDLATTVPAENDIAPHGGAAMLKFVATGNVASTNTVASQMWQLVDLREFATAIAAGDVRADASAWFTRVAGGEATDRRFDLRLLAFDGDPGSVAARYAGAAWIAEQVTSVMPAPGTWQQASVGLTLPPGTTSVLVEVYAYEDVVNDDGEASEFAGHYADDVSLVLTQP